MQAFLVIFGIVTIVVIAVVLLQRLDSKTGRGPRQVSNGIQVSRNVEYRIRCPRCNDQIIPFTGCSFCESRIRTSSPAQVRRAKPDDLVARPLRVGTLRMMEVLKAVLAVFVFFCGGREWAVASLGMLSEPVRTFHKAVDGMFT